MENPKKFNQSEYDKQYKKAHYKKPSILFKTEDYETLKKYCDNFDLSFSEFVKMCCKYCIDNVHIEELKRYK